MIAPHIQIIYAFIQLLKNRNPAFSDTAWSALSDELDPDLAKLPDNNDILLAKKILDWCKSYEVDKALDKALGALRLPDIDEKKHKIQKKLKAKNEMIDNKNLVRETIKEVTRSN